MKKIILKLLNKSGFYTKKQLDTYIFDTINASARGTMDWLESDHVFFRVKATGEKFNDEHLELTTDGEKGVLPKLIYKRMAAEAGLTITEKDK